MAAGAAGAAGGELAAEAIMAELYPGKSAGDLTEEQKQTVSTLSSLAAGLAGAVASNSSTTVGEAAQAGKNAVENNSLSGDKARASLRESADYWKSQVRNKLGEGSLSQLVNSTINALAESSDTAIGSGDYVADAAMALTACAMGDSYCSKALSDLSGKNQAVADVLESLVNGDTWNGIKTIAQQASQGDQVALEDMGGLLAGLVIPGKKVPEVGIITLSTGQTVAEFEKSLFNLPPGERVAQIKQTALSVTTSNGMVKDNSLTKINGRDVYRGTDGNLYALDTQHGRFEMVDAKTGKHLGEVDMG